MSAITSERVESFQVGIMSRVYPQDELVSLSPIRIMRTERNSGRRNRARSGTSRRQEQPKTAVNNHP